MKSPFPGMDPFLEEHWRDVHQRLITYACDALETDLPGDLLIRTEERVYVESGMVPLREIYPDVRVIEDVERAGGTVATIEAPISVDEPVVFHLSREPVSENYIEIIDAGGGRVVTVIEVLSIANKLRGEGMTLYKKKQEEILSAGVGLVEIDLLRAGERVQVLLEDRLPSKLRSPYRVCVVDGSDLTQALFYPIWLDGRLPTFHVPLRKNEQPAKLDLQTIFERVYAKGRYDRTDYHRNPVPPFQGDDAIWADQVLRAAGRR